MSTRRTQTEPHHAFVEVLDHLKDDSAAPYTISGASFAVTTGGADVDPDVPGPEFTFTLTATFLIPLWADDAPHTPADAQGHLIDVLRDAPHTASDYEVIATPGADPDEDVDEESQMVTANVWARITPTVDVSDLRLDMGADHDRAPDG